MRLMHICVNNLAGVPAIVFGVFGLAFFVYFVGEGLDERFFSEELEHLKQRTFGTPGILWASLTMALLAAYRSSRCLSVRKGAGASSTSF